MHPVPKDLQRLCAELDGWLDLRCPEKALERVDTLLARADARPLGLTLRVRAYVALKRHQEAVVDLEELRASDYDPDWVDLTEAWCQKRLADLPAAVRLMERLVERNPRSAIGHFNLGCYLALAGDRERALDEVTLACGLEAEFREMLHDEPDLDCLQRDARFRRLMASSIAADGRLEDGLADDVLAGFEGSGLDLGDEDGDDGGFDDDDDPDEDADDDADDDDVRRR